MNTRLRYTGLLAAGIALPQMSEAANAQAGNAESRPNVIFILADDMGYGDLSCYGSEYVKTPNIDRLAATGTRFTQCYAGSAISSPSRCSLMTGRNSGHARIRDNQCKAGGLTGLKISPRGDTTTVRRANLLPQEELATAQRMRAIMPELVSPQRFEVTVGNVLIKKTIEKFRPSIEAFICKKLALPQISMDIKVAEFDSNTVVLDKAELFRQMMRNSASLNKLHEIFELELN